MRAWIRSLLAMSTIGPLPPTSRIRVVLVLDLLRPRRAGRSTPPGRAGGSASCSRGARDPGRDVDRLVVAGRRVERLDLVGYLLRRHRLAERRIDVLRIHARRERRRTLPWGSRSRPGSRLHRRSREVRRAPRPNSRIRRGRSGCASTSPTLQPRDVHEQDGLASPDGPRLVRRPLGPRHADPMHPRGSPSSRGWHQRPHHSARTSNGRRTFASIRRSRRRPHLPGDRPPAASPEHDAEALTLADGGRQNPALEAPAIVPPGCRINRRRAGGYAPGEHRWKPGRRPARRAARVARYRPGRWPIRARRWSRRRCVEAR